ncbi:MAG: hypothetical protein K8M05_35950, partial [Deltaproteobacteria bacterium]|nr:hypothetical protein [Kofleriaceae bacterium]
PPATDPDAAIEVDAAPGSDAATIDAAATDAPGVPLAGFGAITGMCGVLTPAELDGTSPRWFDGQLDFGTDRYDDPAERDQLTAGGREIILDGNAGGSSLYSEVFAFEWLARCELATLLKTETEIVYDIDGKKADLLVEIDGRKVGVSVVRFVKYPFDAEYLVADALPLVERKLEDLRLATTQVSAADRWTAQMVAAIAYSPEHAQVAMQAWSTLDAETRGATILVVVASEGDDAFIYTDQ